MLYNDRYVPTTSWPPLVRYPSYHPDRRLSILWFLGLAIVALGLSVIALIIVFAVEHSWFHDSFNQTGSGQYGLWRLCFFSNGSCDSWFSSNGPYSILVQARLNQARAGINAWQALEIIFLFLTTATQVTAIASIIFYKIRNSLHYYLAILALFCVWPAASIGISGLFVFGFSVYNVATTPRDLDWCFYLNLAAVILSVIAGILLSIYAFVVKKPIKHINDQDTVVETFADLNSYPPALSPSTYVIVRKNKKKGGKVYDYPKVLHPNHYFTTVPPNALVTGGNTNDFVTNPNYQMLTPYTSVVSTQESTAALQQQQQRAITPYRSVDYNRTALINSPSATTIPPQTSVPPRQYQPLIPPYQYQIHPPTPPHWHRTGTDALNHSIGYASEPVTDYVQRGIYRPNRLNPVERIIEPHQEPRIMHYYTGYDYFAAVDPSDVVATRHHPSTGPGTGVRYTVNPSYRPQNDYLQEKN